MNLRRLLLSLIALAASAYPALAQVPGGCPTGSTVIVGCYKLDGVTLSVSNSILSVVGAAATSVTVGTTTVVTGTPNGLLYDNAGVLGNLATGNSGVLVTSAGGVPSISTTLPNSLAMGTPASLTLTNALGLPLAGLTGLGTGVSTALALATNASGGFPTVPVANAQLANSTISGVALGSNLFTLTFGTHLVSGAANYNGSAIATLTSDATNANTASTIVARDISGNFSAGTITASLTGHASLDLAISALGTGVQTALGVNTGTAGAFVVNGGALGTPSSGTATNLTGLPLAGLASQAANTVVGNFTSGSASPTATAVSSCSAAGNAVNYTTNTGFGCNTSITAAAMAVTGLTGTGTGVVGALQNTPNAASGIVLFSGNIGQASGTSLALGGCAVAPLCAQGAASTSVALMLQGENGASSDKVQLLFYGQQHGNTWSIGGDIAAGGNTQDFEFYSITNNTLNLTIGKTGNLTVGAQLIVASMTQTSAAQTGTVCWASGGLTYDATLGCLTSAETLKTDIAPLTGSLGRIMAAQPITYEWRNDAPKAKADPGTHYGLGAYASGYVSESWIARDADGNPRGWRQDAVIADLVAVVQSQQRDINLLKAHSQTP